jgi:hypothetical protein
MEQIMADDNVPMDDQQQPTDDQQQPIDDQQQQQSTSGAPSATDVGGQEALSSWGHPQMESSIPQDEQFQQQQQQALQQQLDSLQQQNQQLLQQEMQLNEKYESLMREITWGRIIKTFKKDVLVSFLITATLDDLENKIISDEKKNSDLQYMNTIMGTVNQVLTNVTSNPKFADIYCSVFSMALENFDQTKSQRDSIDSFISDVKKYAQELLNKPQPPPQPTSEDQKNQAAAQELQAKAELLKMQTQEIQSKLQQPQQDDGSNDAQELHMKHQFDMELEQAKIAAAQERAQSKIESDEKLMSMKIEADKRRYDEKIKADYLADNIDSPNPPPQV